jgi:hypothetical protein
MAQDGSLHLNGGAVYDSNENDIAGELDLLNGLTATATELNYCDVTTLGVVQASKAVTADANSKIGLARLGSAAASASGLLMGVGTSAAPAASSTADAKFVEIRAKNTATSGDNRLGYFRFDIGGAGGSGECLRAFTDLTAAAASAHGAHFSLQCDATGYVTGQGVGCRNQLYVQGIVPANGTYYGAQAEMYFDENATIAAATKHAVLSVQAAGNATAAATCVNAIAFDGTSAADTTKMISTVSLAELPTGSVGIAVLVNGTRYYIPAVPVAEFD